MVSGPPPSLVDFIVLQELQNHFLFEMDFTHRLAFVQVFISLVHRIPLHISFV